MSTRIAVFGWYAYGNFGDDVMAVMIGRTLRAAGYHPVMYRLPPHLSGPEGFESAPTIEALLDGAAACVLGGGGLLVSAEASFSPEIQMLDEALRQIAAICEARGIPVWGVSIGGTGTGRAAKLYPGLARLLASDALRGVTHRLRDDGPLLQAFDVPAEHYPDLVFAAPDFWPAPAAGSRSVLATNLIGDRLARVLDACAPALLGLVPRNVTARHADFMTAEDRPTGRVDRRIVYRDVQQFADFFSTTKVIISSKLHVGVFAMAYGTLFFSYYGKAKTRAELRQLGLESQFVSRTDLPRWLVRLRTCEGERAASERLAADLRPRAREHLSALLSFVESVDSRRVRRRELV
jgi:hypothetical protein